MEKTHIQILIQQSSEGDMKSFAELVDIYQPLVFRLAFRLLGNEDDAKDMVQETFIKIWSSIDKYNPDYKFSTWIYRIAGNTCYDRLRSTLYSAEERADFDISSLSIVSGENVESAMINKELKELIVFLTYELTPKQKLVFTLKDLEELEIDEIVTITGLTPAKIKSNLYLARKYIREKINRKEY